MLLSFPTESERQRWMAAVTPPSSQVVRGGKPSPPPCIQVEGEKIYEDWDCPKVEAMAPHRGVEEDELELARGEQANVIKKTTDGQSTSDAKVFLVWLPLLLFKTNKRKKETPRVL